MRDVRIYLTHEQLAVIGGRELVILEHAEACTSCGETFTAAELDPADNDHCPRCGDIGTMTTYYGRPDREIRESDLGDPDEIFVEKMAADMAGPMTPEREAELREDALELDHGQLARALREALDAMAYERARADAAEAKLARVRELCIRDGALPSLTADELNDAVFAELDKS